VARRPLPEIRKIRSGTLLVVGQMLATCGIASLSGSGNRFDNTGWTLLVIGGRQRLFSGERRPVAHRTCGLGRREDFLTEGRLTLHVASAEGHEPAPAVMEDEQLFHEVVKAVQRLPLNSERRSSWMPTPARTSRDRRLLARGRPPPRPRLPGAENGRLTRAAGFFYFELSTMSILRFLARPCGVSFDGTG
jgi:hypothetical protein